MINQGIMLNVSTVNFTHNRILRADNTFLTFALRTKLNINSLKNGEHLVLRKRITVFELFIVSLLL